MKWLTYDLESTFLQKGYKRGDTLILEIALFKGKREAVVSMVCVIILWRALESSNAWCAMYFFPGKRTLYSRGWL